MREIIQGMLDKVIKVSDGNMQQWFDDDTGEWVALTEEDITLLKARQKER